MNLNNISKARKFTKNEVILIYILFALGILYISANKFIMPKWQEYKMASDSLNSAQNRCDNLKKEYGRINEYKDEEKDAKDKLTALIKQFPPYISQEDIIITIGKYANEHNVDIKTIALDDEKSTLADKVISNNEKSFDDLFNDDGADKNDKNGTNQEKSEQDSYAGDKSGVPTVLAKYVSISFNGEIGNLYNFINDLEKNEHKLFVRQLSINKSEDDNLIGNMKIQYVGYKENNGKESDFKLTAPKVNGKTNPFNPYEGYSGDSSSDTSSDGIPVALNEPNFYLQLNEFNTKEPKYILSEYKKQDTEIYNNSNQPVEGTIKISKDDDKFNYSYQLGSSSKSEVKDINVSDGIIRMEVNSRKRASDGDKMGVTMNVENNTDLMFEITLVNDDYDNPLFKLGKQIGKVDLKRVNK